tara:strand:+ start:1324 stop:1656 length:333 start_codon:yes stop_codon:yes gene_type:complete
MKRLINKNPYTNKEIWWHDNKDGTYTIEEKMHIKEVLEQNRKFHNAYEKGSMIGNTQKHWQHVAEIPNTLYLELKQKFGDPKDNPEASKKWKAYLNDPDNRYLRTGGGWL